MNVKDVYLVFNDSCLPSFSSRDRNTIDSCMQVLSDVITQARQMSLKAMVTRVGFGEMPLVSEPTYTMRDWMHDKQADREVIRRVRSAATQYDPLELEDDHEVRQAEKRGRDYIYTYETRPADALGFARLLDSVAVSLCANEAWGLTEIEIESKELSDESDDFIVKPHRVRHATQPQHLSVHRNWLQEVRFATSVRDGKDLLEKTKIWFPHLVFTEVTKAQIEMMASGTPQLRQAVERFFDLENYCQSNHGGIFDKNRLRYKATPESGPVRQNPVTRALRTFKLDNGREEYFEWHLRLTPDEWRLFFLPDMPKNKIYIGYIGRKLSTDGRTL